MIETVCELHEDSNVTVITENPPEAVSCDEELACLRVCDYCGYWPCGCGG